MHCKILDVHVLYWVVEKNKRYNMHIGSLRRTCGTTCTLGRWDEHVVQHAHWVVETNMWYNMHIGSLRRTCGTTCTLGRWDEHVVQHAHWVVEKKMWYNMHNGSLRRICGTTCTLGRWEEHEVQHAHSTHRQGCSLQPRRQPQSRSLKPQKTAQEDGTNAQTPK